MRLVDTTDVRAEVGVRALVNSASAARVCQLAGKFRVNLLGIYVAEVGCEWDSGGRRESDFLHHIELPLGGERRIIHQGGSCELSPGTIWFLPGNTPVERKCRERCEVLFFKFNCEWLPGVDPLLDWPGRGPRAAGSFDPAEWRGWAERNRACGVRELLRLRGLLLSWIVAAVPEFDEVITSHLASHMQFSKVFDTIEQNLGADLRMSEIARAHGTGVDAFSVAFARSIGMSPKEYLVRRINQEALSLVISTDLKMKEIAGQLRFSDEFYFSRFFKKHNGCSPMWYRKRLRQGLGD